MTKHYRQLLSQFTIDSLPTLDTVVRGALEMLADNPVPKFDTLQFNRPLVVGSGNAEATGRVMFAGTDAVFASESTIDEKLAAVPAIDEVVIISASGGKHAPGIAKKARSNGKHVTLVTTTKGSAVEQQLGGDELTVWVYPKNREPYTYNTSTYMSMILSTTSENPVDILRFIDEQIDSLELPDFSGYNKYFLIVPPQFSELTRMLEVKFIELFGRQVARDVETSEYVSHATTVVPSDELFISFGEPNTQWGDALHRLNVPLPAGAGDAAMMAIGYYLIGQIQKAQPSYFQDNIVSYCQSVSEIFGEDIQPIVDGRIDQEQ